MDTPNRYEPNFEHNESGEPFIELRIKIGEIAVDLRLDYESTAVFTHKEEDEHLDHIFVSMENQSTDEETRAMGAFIWRQVLPDWDDLVDSLDDRDFQHIHSPYPSPHDAEQYESTGLIPPTQNFIKPDVKVIEEVEDDDVVAKQIKNIDHELSWFLNDPHYFDRIKPRPENGTA